MGNKGSQVENMLIAEYDYETDIRVQRNEAWEDGLERGRVEEKRNLIEKLIRAQKTDREIMELLECSQSLVEDVRKMII